MSWLRAELSEASFELATTQDDEPAIFYVKGLARRIVCFIPSDKKVCQGQLEHYNGDGAMAWVDVFPAGDNAHFAFFSGVINNPAAEVVAGLIDDLCDKLRSTWHGELNYSVVSIDLPY